MSDIAIHVEHLGKCYHISQRAAYDTFQEAIINAASAPFRWLKRGSNSNSSDPQSFWALKDVSFDVENGDVLGIIGRNGSGKSTLLKILSRITVPTEGRAEIHGRAGSLLEVGTGFHPELTGRENIYLSGSIIGMKKREIEDKFDEIVRFSEIDKFLDTPVKHYSSGMHVRLAFAVAAHLDPEILMVDEVLAVGDAAFQKKCLGKMRNVANEGRTVLFVSHNMGAVSQLCSRAILLDAGVLVDQGVAQDVVSDYFNRNNNSTNTSWVYDANDIRIKNEILTPLRLSLLDASGRVIPPIVSRFREVYVKLELMLHRIPANLTLGVSLFKQDGTLLFRTQHTDVDEAKWPQLKIGRNILRMKMPMEILNEGDYMVVLDCSLHKKWLFNPFENGVSVKFGIKGGLSDSPYWIKGRAGLLAPIIYWDLIEE